MLAGNSGICNTMAPNWCDLSGLADIPNKPPILWIRGAQDLMVSDTSACDLVYLGKAGRAHLPGKRVCPSPSRCSARPACPRQIQGQRRVLTTRAIPGGHGCMLTMRMSSSSRAAELFREKFKKGRVNGPSPDALF